MLVREARAGAKEWVSASAARMPGFRSAFFSGSTAALSPDSILSNESDVDVVVVVASSNGPPKLGKFRYEDACSAVRELLGIHDIADLFTPQGCSEANYYQSCVTRLLPSPTGQDPEQVSDRAE